MALRRTVCRLVARGGAEPSYPSGRDWRAPAPQETHSDYRLKTHTFDRNSKTAAMAGNWSYRRGRVGEPHAFANAGRIESTVPASQLHAALNTQMIDFMHSNLHSHEVFTEGYTRKLSNIYEPSLEAAKDGREYHFDSMLRRGDVVGAARDVMVPEESEVYSPQTAEALAEVKLSGTVTVRVSVGDIVAAGADAVCCNSDARAPLDVVAAALAEAAGGETAAATEHQLTVIGEIPVGCAGSVPAGSLQSQRLVYVSAPAWKGGDYGEAVWLRAAIEAALNECRFHQLQSVALPRIGAGWPAAASAAVCADALSDWAECEARHGSGPAAVDVVLYQPADGPAFADAMQAAQAAQ
eukprot:TRINITY_DN26155_c0_g1_i1.p1 TRINITY_DN26155_c0_g1~~TRINITY_DN26155_c0_g1_i1.p1  ORF type:complete len:353 (+),score=117.26 TRINITY_DN26155_c0_g1_i1:125-1183(+)